MMAYIQIRFIIVPDLLANAPMYVPLPNALMMDADKQRTRYRSSARTSYYPEGYVFVSSPSPSPSSPSSAALGSNSLVVVPRRRNIWNI
jgi:hypothetical protein